MSSRRFRDRQDAGRQLAAVLAPYEDSRPLILALPRGGVPVAFEIAKALRAPLDVLLVRKLGAPGHPELGIGAVVDGVSPQLVLNEAIVQGLVVDPGYIQGEEQRQLAEIERRRKLYRGDAPAAEIRDRTVIVVDDGIATGGTVKAALRGLKRGQPDHLILAVPVAPQESLNELALECDELVCLHAPEDFWAVGTHFADFSQTEDEEVIRLLAAARRT